VTEKVERIVVGVDGSECSLAALRWAKDFVASRGGTVVLVTAWHWPLSYGTPIAYEGFDPEADAGRVLDAAAQTLDLPDDRVERVVAQGPPGCVLVDAAKGAALLVVGTRGHGNLAGALLGSTSNYCAHHAPCPVVIVR
jgi:nucleotide-binding universal stress UspA family protein